MLQKALRDRSLSAESFKSADASKIGPLLSQAIGLFVREVDRDRARRELADLCERAQPTVKAKWIAITSEKDIAVARQQARQICEEMAAASYVVQKVTTIVSELARNIVSYAGSGTLELAPMNGQGRRLVIRAADSGPGIPNLDLVLSGRYQSKTGLGRGLLGTKRLADNFGVATGSRGTTVVVEVVV
jgi:serine/threonine-protein kinase RsbT